MQWQCNDRKKDKIQQLSFGMKNKKGQNIPVKTANKKLAFCRNLPLEILKYYVNL